MIHFIAQHCFESKSMHLFIVHARILNQYEISVQTLNTTLHYAQFRLKLTLIFACVLQEHRQGKTRKQYVNTWFCCGSLDVIR